MRTGTELLTQFEQDLSTGDRLPTGKKMYAIAFDLVQDELELHYPGRTKTNAYNDIRRVLERYGFTNQQGSVYFGNETVDAVIAVVAVQTVAKNYPWFTHAVRDIRMLRIEDNNDLRPAIDRVLGIGDQINLDL